MPKFKVEPEKSLELKPSLIGLGMTDPFDRTKANFLGIADPPKPDDRLYISEVYHQAVVEVDEAGTEGAAATAVVMARAGSAAMADPEHIKIDRPFMFGIYDEGSGAVLFLGRVADPRS